MKFGLFILMPQRDGEKPVHVAAAEAIDQIRVAEDLGFDIAWFAEHHFSNYSLVPSPLTMAAHVAGLTKRIRLGTGVIVTPLYEPMRLLEDIAFVDQLSGGRLVVGLGSGYQEHECERFGVNLDDSRAMLGEMIDLIEKAYTERTFSHDGAFYKVPPTSFSVLPLQKPYPELFLAGLTRDEAIQTRMARTGIVPFISAQWKPASEVLETRRQIEGYYRAVGRDPAALRLAVQRFVYVTEDAGDALAAAEHLRYTYRIAHGFRMGPMDFDGHIIDSKPVSGEPTLAEIAERAIIGDPEKCARQLIDEVRTLGPEHISCVMQFGGLTGAQVMRSMELLGGKVIPAMERELGDLATYGGKQAGQAAE